MKIQGISSYTFGRKLTADEAQEYAKTLTEAKQAVGQTGKSVLIVHDACLPQSAGKNTGVANLAGADSAGFFEFAKKYLGINGIEVLPQGQVQAHKNRYGAYSGTSLSLGNHQINLELLQTPEYENLLTPKDFQEVVNSNTATDKDTIVNWHNVMDNDSPHDKAVRKAFERFQKLPETSKLKHDFAEYCTQNEDWLERKSIFEVLSKKYGTWDTRHWASGTDQNLYSLPKEKQSARIAEILKENPTETEFYKFKQFLAESHLQKGRSQLNNMGLKLYGDFPLGFTRDEIWAYPNAFKRTHNMGLPFWNMASLDFDKILTEGSEANKLLKTKLSLYGRRYDSLRVDSAWNYIKPIITPAGEKSLASSTRKNFGSTLLDYMESILKKVKGENFSADDLIYEFEAGPDEFSMWEDGKLIPGVKNRTKVLNTLYMKSTTEGDWGYHKAYTERGLAPFSLGVGNHDSQPLRQIAEGIPEVFYNDEGKTVIDHKTPAIPVLADELNLAEKTLRKPEEFAKAKWAEALLGRDNHMFYADVFGKRERFNSTELNSSAFFGLKIPANYEDAYIKSIQEGFGYNPMDAMEKLFTLKNKDKSNPLLFARIRKFKEILLEPEKAVTKAISDSKLKSSRNLVVIGMGIVAAFAGGFLYKTAQGNSSDNFQSQQESVVKF